MPLNNKIQDIYLDITAHDLVSIKCSQYDVNSRTYTIHLLDNGKIYLLDSSLHYLKFKQDKQDGTMVFNDCTINSDGTATYTLTEQSCLFAGAYNIQFIIYDISSKQILNILPARLSVAKSVADNLKIQSTNEFNTLNKIILENEDIQKQLLQVKKEVEEFEKEAEVQESTRQQNETSRISAENNRVSAENERNETESQRVAAENKRASSESDRLDAEKIRVQNENERISNEDKRNDSEQIRVSNEETRKSQENTRESNEADRINNENARVLAENTRIENEDNRTKSESTRQSNEESRQKAESARVTAENNRGNQETIRQNNESTRVSNENTRVSNEQKREENETQRINNESERVETFNDTMNSLETWKQGVESSVDKKVDKTTTVNGKSLSGNITLTADDVGAAIVDDITNALINYYKKSETYTQTEINQMVSAIPKFAISAVDSLPTSNISSTTIYLLKTSTTETNNLYTEYIYINSSWEKLGTQTLDLSGYATKASLATVATSGSYNDLKDKPEIPTTASDIGLGNVENKSSATILSELTKDNVVSALGYTPGSSDITVDSALSTTSTNPVQNKIVTSEINNKLPLSGGTMSGSIIPNGNSTIDFGSESAKWHYGYFHRIVNCQSICNSTNYATNMLTLPSKAGTIAITSDIPTKTSSLTNDSGFLTSHQDISGKLNISGGTLTGDIEFSQLGNSGIRGITGLIATNDYWRIVGGATAENSGYLEIATADDGNEPIYVRQYSSGKFATIGRTATLLDSGGNTSFPGTVTATTFDGNATTATTASKLGSSTVGSSTTPIYLNSGSATSCSGRTVPGIKSASAVTTLGWGTNDNYVADMTMLAHWNGAYSGASSNLAYCNKGAFGDMATKTASNYALSSHTHSYLPLSGGTLTGTLTFANNTWNLVGDDAYIGDHNVSGGLGILGANGKTRLDFCQYGDASNYKSITFDGSTLYMNGNCNYATLAGTADTLDGYHASHFLTSSIGGNIVMNGNTLWFDDGTYYGIECLNNSDELSIGDLTGGNSGTTKILNDAVCEETLTVKSAIKCNSKIGARNIFDEENANVVMATRANQVTLYWTGTQLDLYVDKTRIGKVVTA
jgi:hypothetical protein